jgi:hypothetical protein
MRGKDHQRGHQGGYVDPEAVVPADHPLRPIRPLVNAALTRLSPEFDQLYSLTALFADRPALDPARATAAGVAAAGVLHGPLGAAVDGANDL